MNDRRCGVIQMLGSLECALFLDFDGTLIDLAPRPDGVTVAPGLVEALAVLRARLGGRLAIISGRPIEEIDAMLAPLTLPVAGVHGMERRTADGTLERVPAPSLEAVRARALELAACHDALLVEDKHGAIALHYRQAAHLETLCRTALREAVRGCDGLLLMEGKMVLEVKAANISKGSAIAEFMAEAPFAGYRPLFVGDDTTDEAGFAYAQGIGGLGLKVGPGPTVARHRIASARALRAALADLADIFIKENP